jgi:hypothetical protein
MANPRGNLAGWSDPSKPGWQSRVMKSVVKNQKGTKRHTERISGVLATFDDPFRVLLEEVCRRRNISRQGYARRAIAAFIAHDLGMELADVLKHCAIPIPYDTRVNRKPVRTEDDGTGMGPWRITGVEDA